jgi:UDP-N-acetylglucosamine 3-dehydrogenase
MHYFSMNVSVSVLGCGVWGRSHARVFSEIPNVRLVSVVDLNQEAAREVSKRYNTSYAFDPAVVLENPEVDAVTICTPTITHSELALRAIEAGKHVLVEKPMTNTIEEAKTLIRAAENNGVHLSVGFVERFNPAVQEAYRLISEGAIGNIILAHTRRVSRWPVRIGDVGVIKDLAVHDIDIVNKLFGEEAGSVYAHAGSIQHSFEDYANIIMRFKGKRGAFIETNWLTPRKVRTLTITGTEAIINVEYLTQTLTLENEKQITQPYINNEEPLRLELESFVNSIMKDTTPEVTGMDGLRALRVCEAAIESAQTGRKVIINPRSLDYPI